MNGDIAHLVQCSHHQRCSANCIHRTKPHLPFVQCCTNPGITRNIEQTYFACGIFKADEQNGIRPMLWDIICIYRIIKSKHKHIRIPVKAYIDCTTVLLLPHKIRHIHIAHIAVCLNTPADDVVACNAGKHYKKEGTYKFYDSAEKVHTPTLFPLTAPFVDILTRIFTRKLRRNFLRIILCHIVLACHLFSKISSFRAAIVEG